MFIIISLYINYNKKNAVLQYIELDTRKFGKSVLKLLKIYINWKGDFYEVTGKS